MADEEEKEVTVLTLLLKLQRLKGTVEEDEMIAQQQAVVAKQEEKVAKEQAKLATMKQRLQKLHADKLLAFLEPLGEDEAGRVLLSAAEETYSRRPPELITDKVVRSRGINDHTDDVQRLIESLVPPEKKFYVGKSSGNNFLQRWHDRKHDPFCCALVFQTKDEKEQNDMERDMIKAFRYRLYNKRKGGGGPTVDATLYYVYIIY